PSATGGATMDLADLPTITVSNVRPLDPSQTHFDCEISGIVTHVHQLEVDCGYWCYLTGGDYSPLATVVSLDTIESTARLHCTIFSEYHPIVVGESYPLLTEYWNADIYAAILDHGRVW